MQNRELMKLVDVVGARPRFIKVGLIFQTPWVTLRDETEWMETVESGWSEVY